MTGEWEAKLAHRARLGDLGTFMGEIESYVRDVVGSVASGVARVTCPRGLDRRRPRGRAPRSPSRAFEGPARSSAKLVWVRLLPPVQEEVCLAGRAAETCSS